MPTINNISDPFFEITTSGVLKNSGNVIATQTWVGNNYNNYDDSDVDSHLSGGTGINYSTGTISIDSTVATQTWVGNNYNNYSDSD